MNTLKELLKDKLALISTMIILLYIFIAILSKLNIIFPNWDMEVAKSYQAPGISEIFGTDILGRSVLAKTFKGIEVAISVGLIVAISSGIIGLILGATAGYFGGIIDQFIIWIYTTISSIPNIILLLSFSYIFGKGINTICIALSFSLWVDLCRLIRGEVIKHKNREYVTAATAIGVNHLRKIFIHILPNIIHIFIIQFSIIFQIAIKSEIILSFMGLGVQNRPSWGTMIDDGKAELLKGVWWQITAASIAIFIILISLNKVADYLINYINPKLSDGC